jgi:hypothetical protein
MTYGFLFFLHILLLSERRWFVAETDRVISFVQYYAFMKDILYNAALSNKDLYRD